MSVDFDTAFNRLVNHEGGYSDDPKDPGNWTGGRTGSGQLKGTKFGIAANTYGHLDIKNLTLEQAKSIYRTDFWDVVDSHPAVKFQVFDFAVNSGSGTAIRKLQAAIGVADDGHWGPQSAATLKKMDVSDVLMLYLAERLDFMRKLPVWPTYSGGWSARIASNLRLAAQDN